MDGNAISNILSFLVFMVFLLVYPRLMLSQVVSKLELSARNLELLSMRARKIIARKTGNRGSEKEIALFQEFFSVEPMSLDPFGIVKKIDHLTRMSEKKFERFVERIAPHKDKIEKKRINYALRSAISVHQIAKLVRHYVEMTKKFKNFQIALLLQMQLPQVEKLAESEFNGTKAFLDGFPVGDSIGSLVAASLIEKAKPIATGVVMGETKILGRRVFVLKADGPGPELGRFDEALEKILKRHKIAKVITIDAMSKLEGEKTGSVAYGVGFGMASVAEREIIENMLLPRKIPVEVIGIKVGMEEAITPMRKSIFDALPKVVELIKEFIKETKRTDKIVVIGVGNSSGVGNTKHAVNEVREKVLKIEKMINARKEEKKGWF